MARSMAFVFAAAAFIAAAPVHAQEDEPVEPIDGAPSQGLADQLANPVANLISVPIQFNYDCCYGPADGDRLTVNIQPVIPISVAQDWNLITRTILPIVSQEETVRGEGGASGLGDTVQSFFLSPKKASNGFVWGVGPVFLWPTGASAFSAKKFGAGPTAVALKQGGGITVGLLANHIWSFADAGDYHRAGVSSSFIQPFVTKTLPDSTASVSHVFAFGKQPVSLAVGARYYAERPEDGPNWGVRFVMTFLFPK